LESEAKTDPSIRLAIGHLRSAIPKLAAKLTEGQEFISHGPGGTGRGTVKDGEFRTRSRSETDGSIIQPTDHARKSITKILRKSGVGDSPIEEALRRSDEAPENERVSLAPGLDVVKWRVDRIEPDLRKGVLLKPLVPLKIAYEFLACHLGTATYGHANQMSELRMVLRERIESHPCYAVERLHASEYKPCHGIVFEGNEPYAKVLIRLFGSLAFRVHFKNLAVCGHRFVYTHQLDSNEEDVRILKCEKTAP